jgi:hypothetical protein
VLSKVKIFKVGVRYDDKRILKNLEFNAKATRDKLIRTVQYDMAAQGADSPPFLKAPPKQVEII